MGMFCLFQIAWNWLPMNGISSRRAWRTRIVLCVVMLFAVCWAPLQALNVWNAIDPEHHSTSVHVNNLRVFCLCLAYANSCINPIVYALAGASYRHHLQQMVSGNNKRGRSFNSRFSPTGGGNSSYRSVRRLSRTEATSVSTCVWRSRMWRNVGCGSENNDVSHFLCVRTHCSVAVSLLTLIWHRSNVEEVGLPLTSWYANLFRWVSNDGRCQEPDHYSIF